MFPAFNLGSLALPTAPLIYILGAWFCLSGVERAAKTLNQPVNPVYNLASVGLFAGVVGARLTFVGLHWSTYQSNLVGIVWPLNSGFHLGGGLLVGLTAAFFYGRYRQLSPAPTLDALIPGILIGLISVSLADFLAGPGLGKLSTLPWAISIFGLRRHPVQLYEILVGLLALLLWWQWRHKRTFAGQLFLLTTSLYSSGRLFVDAFRANAWVTADGFHVLQIIAFAILLISLFLMAQRQETQPQV